MYLIFIKFFNYKYSACLTIFIHSIYELKDYLKSYTSIFGDKPTYTDSVLNSIGDSIGCLIGIYLEYVLKINLITSCNITLILVLFIMTNKLWG